ncbi:type II toxin-antitoxin system Phd/YefM family antitoxin [Sphingomonas sp. 8AM]|uniref:type II toxin-antitoxin system Phd/YefM family antitoxin n=1 Tax=Sphingomonas sp. 8AM TaxID=2653170 RepID=UPI0012EFDA47|nr:type II toxin-antitoxin system prevent-host-death family antitoxin [Sphingomonas sp. 8AM]VXC64938.1 Antitoxin [Sphingomonas sp. 8AM]
MAEADPQKTFNVHEAKTQLSRLIERAHAGEEIVLAKAGVPYAKLVPIDPPVPARRTPGRFKGLMDMSPEESLASCFTDEELEELENRSIFPPAP